MMSSKQTLKPLKTPQTKSGKRLGSRRALIIYFKKRKLEEERENYHKTNPTLEEELRWN